MELQIAQERTLKFIEHVKQAMALFGADPATEPFIDMCIKMQASLTTEQEHYELREQIAGAFSSAAYDYIFTSWKALG